MKYDVIFANGKRFEKMTPEEFYMFFHGYSGLDYAVYNQQGILVGTHNTKGEFIGKLRNGA